MTRPGLPRLPARLALFALPVLLLAGCAAQTQPAHGYATLPRDSVQGASEPTRSAIFGTAYAFNTPASLAGRPADAARAVANYEYLAAELPTGPRWREFNPTVATQLATGLEELRPALGIAPDAESQPVIGSLYAASRALTAGDQAAAERALAAPIFTAGGAETLHRLNALPPLPRVAQASALAATELTRQMQGGRGGGQRD